MAQIFERTGDPAQEVLKLNINDPDFDFLTARQMAKDKALEKCDNPMILSRKISALNAGLIWISLI